MLYDYPPRLSPWQSACGRKQLLSSHPPLVQPDSEIEIRKVYLQLDRYLSDNYGKGEDLTEIKLMQALIIAHNFLT